MDAEILEVVSPSPGTTAAIGAAIGSVVNGGEWIALEGELGSGKTLLVRSIADGLGLDASHVSSPTFVFIQRHRGGRLDLVHADAYRLRSAAELEGSGWSDLAGNADAVTAIEWPSRVPGAIPPDAVRIELRHADAEMPQRRIIRIIDADRDRAARWRNAIAAALAPAPCPVCGRALPPESPEHPFCSPRCRSADLGRWFSGRYRVSRPLGPEDLDER